MSRRIPSWLRTRLPSATETARIRVHTYESGLPTICSEARCPNQGECSRLGTAAFLILGDRCTRNCAFCAVIHGAPRPVSPHDAKKVALAVKALGLKHAVVTSVTRDDLSDGGASVFAQVIHAIRNEVPAATIEVLVPDFKGSIDAIDVVIQARPDVINHNLETVPRLYPALRPQASYERSLALLQRVNQVAPSIMTKSGIMMGVGESWAEVEELIQDLVTVNCRSLTAGQYFQPTPAHYPVHRFVSPEEFASLRKRAMILGMMSVQAGPFVRSSYHAHEALERRESLSDT